MPSTGEAKRRQNKRNNAINNLRRDAARALKRALDDIKEANEILQARAPVLATRSCSKDEESSEESFMSRALICGGQTASDSPVVASPAPAGRSPWDEHTQEPEMEFSHADLLQLASPAPAGLHSLAWDQDTEEPELTSAYADLPQLEHVGDSMADGRSVVANEWNVLEGYRLLVDELQGVAEDHEYSALGTVLQESTAEGALASTGLLTILQVQDVRHQVGGGAFSAFSPIEPAHSVGGHSVSDPAQPERSTPTPPALITHSDGSVAPTAYPPRQLRSYQPSTKLLQGSDCSVRPPLLCELDEGGSSSGSESSRSSEDGYEDGSRCSNCAGSSEDENGYNHDDIARRDVECLLRRLEALEASKEDGALAGRSLHPALLNLLLTLCREWLGKSERTKAATSRESNARASSSRSIITPTSRPPSAGSQIARASGGMAFTTKAGGSLRDDAAYAPSFSPVTVTVTGGGGWCGAILSSRRLERWTRATLRVIECFWVPSMLRPAGQGGQGHGYLYRSVVPGDSESA